MDVPTNTRSTTVVAEPIYRSVSWPAVFAGAVLAFMVMAILNMLAFGVGISSIDLTGDGSPVAGLGAGLGWAMIIINLIAYAAGGYLAGRLAGPYRHHRGMLHGLLTWAVMVLVSAWLVTSAAGTILGGVGSVIGSGFNLVAQGAGALAPAVSEGVQNATEELDLSGTDIQSQLSDLLLESADADTSPALAEVQVRQLVDSVFTEGQDPFSAENRETLVDLLEDETELTPAEAEEVVSAWEERYVAAQQRLEQMQAQLTAAAEEAQAAITRTMLWGAFALIVLALIAAWAGQAGANARRTEPVAVRRV